MTRGKRSDTANVRPGWWPWDGQRAGTGAKRQAILDEDRADTTTTTYGRPLTSLARREQPNEAGGRSVHVADTELRSPRRVEGGEVNRRALRDDLADLAAHLCDEARRPVPSTLVLDEACERFRVPRPVASFALGHVVVDGRLTRRRAAGGGSCGLR